MSVSTEAGNRTGPKRVCLPVVQSHRRATDTGRVLDDGHSSTVYIPATCVCSNRGTSIVTVDDVGK